MEKQWYIIHTYSGFEKKVKESSAKTAVAAFGASGQNLPEMMIPDRGCDGRCAAARQLSPRACCIPAMFWWKWTWTITPGMWCATRRGSPGFCRVPGQRRPTPLSETEVENILHRVTTSADRPKPKLVFERNEQVRIVEGPFANFTGVVDDVNADRNTLKVSVTIFGRSTPVELDFVQVEKMA